MAGSKEVKDDRYTESLLLAGFLYTFICGKAAGGRFSEVLWILLTEGI